MSHVLTLADVARHTSREDAYIVLGDSVCNVSPFLEEHPGGEEVLLELAGQDATDGFNEANHTERAHEILSGLAIGKVRRVEGDPAPRSLKSLHGESGESARKVPREITGSASASGKTIFYVMALSLGVFIAATAYQHYKTKEDGGGL